MPNAWFYYFFPLFIGAAFVAAGLTVFRRFARGYHDSKGRQYGSGEGCFGVLFAIVGATLTLGPDQK
ncbi:MAG TPA: hypothetical protein VN541_21590 [Tepidisphaeraceae bacterium]|nr:hypothetical protein [Tepidisphaeraceae bacterium]